MNELNTNDNAAPRRVDPEQTHDTRDTDATIPADSRHPDSISRAPETQALPLGVIARRALDKGGPDDTDERRKRRYALQKPDQVARTSIHCQCECQETENGSSDPLLQIWARPMLQHACRGTSLVVHTLLSIHWLQPDRRRVIFVEMFALPMSNTTET